ncbi:3-oxoacyl-ACP synthase [candidate division WOR-1 bacterium RIFOXYA12_FULL_43_27]|uniref:3-oxoacyl-ACP synthase n=1 Tax=candidate division WOR-1 bacterium RIFOXYC2_FULL_46_14 TaxID=1802587 RepID=A0A1F4U3H2_UNCSA|nr:MAG: 3-oxoacyl-ACP synthase [candidate division WOR-1 bacterium RIFOXYA12_FULL_43_27]OGC20202.1 MAG: 3-oxoacyl-ACP synthase [candidate division WOR-1 bacterium RIFOXYB2_FULL_46_45]OGC32060.1 MAG: 3-oxoacyl-ACP synthase [candidate division WOR-1 bacterium RIFOXYA2_FULL_46_56]OGC39462.1 MAG: 3-oxoacyl-ACP synthase [candidate division WOR-1 bacterium RIFOXYC2_FULL_46_14]
MSAKSKFSNVKISGIASIIPPIRKSIVDEIDLYGGDIKQIERIRRRIGLDVRFVVDERTTSSDLCEYAANIMFKSLSFNPEDIDALIFVSQTPDYFIPSTSCYLHGKLKLSKDCAAFDVNLGCSGYVYGLWLSHLMIEAGSCRNVLLLAGDTISKCVNPKDRSAAPLFGDAGSATLIQRSEENKPAHFILHSDGRGYDSIILPAGGFRMPKSATTAKEIRDDENNVRSQEDLYINGSDIFSFAINEIPSAISEILSFSDKKPEDIDHVIFHQANKYIIENIARKIDFPMEKIPSDIITKYGNQSCASIPVTICDSVCGKIAENKMVILAGFGVGLSWGTAVLSLDQIYSTIEFYKGGEQNNEKR